MKRAAALLLAASVLSPLPALADIDLSLGGFWRGYAVVTDNGETGTAAASDDLRDKDFRRDVELYVEGKTTLDNGVTLGFMHEQDFGGANANDESYLYFQGGFGRVNLGSEDGAAYLLQTFVPGADENIDGRRVYIQALNSDGWNDNDFTDGDFDGERLDYDNADFKTDRVTYLTPKWNGFQAGFSYAPETGQNAVGNNIAGMGADDTVGDFEHMHEAAVAWKGDVSDVAVSFSAGYAAAPVETAAAAGLAGSDDRRTWNAGLDLGVGEFGVGFTWLESNNGVEPLAGEDADTTSFQLGADWDRGPYHLGASWYRRSFDEGVPDVGANDLDVDRYTAGGTYGFGPGMTFRGAVSVGTADANTAGQPDIDFTQIAIGTEVQF